MTEYTGRISPERYLMKSAALSVVMALVLSRIPALAFGGFIRMAIVLVAADVVLYALTKAKVLS